MKCFNLSEALEELNKLAEDAKFTDEEVAAMTEADPAEQLADELGDEIREYLDGWGEAVFSAGAPDLEEYVRDKLIECPELDADMLYEVFWDIVNDYRDTYCETDYDDDEDFADEDEDLTEARSAAWQGSDYDPDDSEFSAYEDEDPRFAKQGHTHRCVQQQEWPSMSVASSAGFSDPYPFPEIGERSRGMLKKLNLEYHIKNNGTAFAAVLAKLAADYPGKFELYGDFASAETLRPMKHVSSYYIYRVGADDVVSYVPSTAMLDGLSSVNPKRKEEFHLLSNKSNVNRAADFVARELHLS